MSDNFEFLGYKGFDAGAAAIIFIYAAGAFVGIISFALILFFAT